MRAHRAIAACCFLVACGGPVQYESTDQALCPAGARVEGVDVSVFQGTVDWASVKNAGRVFGIARISDGSFLDTQFDQNWSGMKAAGLVRGSYQFFEPGEDPVAQANIVVQKVGLLGDGDLPVVADMEVTGGQSAATIAANLQTWIDHVKSGTGKTPMIYTAPGYWNGSVGSTAFGNDPLWVANWGVSCPSLPTGWSNFKFWQYSDMGSVSGISATVDLDKFNGSLTDLNAFAGASASYAAAYVSQSWPLATTTFTMTAGQVMHANIVLKNVGTKAWDSNTRLATTQPRDRMSPFAASNWVSPNRLSQVSGTVPPGGTFQFNFDFQAPSQPGMYDEFYGVVEDGVAWFSDPGQGGPPDNQIEAKIKVDAAPVMDAGAPPPPDAGPEAVDAGPVDAGSMMTLDAGAEDAGSPEDGGHATTATRSSGCGCGTTPGAEWMLLGIAALASRRRSATT